jgi:nucleoside-diphosphate-sugar epimerase
MTRILALTGATGFAGGHILREALRRGWRVRALVRSLRSDWSGDIVDQVVGDLANTEALGRIADGADCVVHAAGAVAAPTRRLFFAINAEGTAHVAAAAKRAGVRRLVHISSLAAREPELSPYAASKLASEAVARDHASAVILRPPAVYGPGDRGILPIVQQLTRKTALLPANPNQRFSLIYAEDLGRIVLDAADANWIGTRDADDGTPNGYSWNDLLALASEAEDIAIRPVFLPKGVMTPLAHLISAGARLASRSSLLSPGKVAELYFHDWVARDALTSGEMRVTFRDGFPLTVAWYRQHGWLPERRAADRRRQARSEENRAR